MELAITENEVKTSRSQSTGTQDRCNEECLPESSVKENGHAPVEKKWWLLPTLGLLLLIAGTLNVALTKAMNKQKLPPCPGCDPKYFQAPMFQSFLVTLAEVIVLAIYQCDRLITVKKKKRVKGTFDLFTSEASFLKVQLPYGKWILPGILHAMNILLFNHAILLTHATVVQFARNFNILCAAFMRTFILRKAIHVYEWIGVVIMTAGLAVTGVYGVVQPETASNIDPKLSWIGVVLAVLGTVNQCFMYTLEEKLTRQYYCAPMKFVGMEGLVAMPIMIVAIVIAHFTGYENFQETLYMERHNYILPLLAAGFIMSVGVFTTAGLSVSKLGSAVLRVILMSFRTVSLFLLEIALGWNSFHWLGLVSMVFLILGSLVFHNLPPIPLECYTKPVMCCMCLHLEAPPERTKAAKQSVPFNHNMNDSTCNGNASGSQNELKEAELSQVVTIAHGHVK